MDDIKFIGLKELEDVDQEMTRTIAVEYYGKIQRALKNLTTLVVHIKASEKGGHRQRYEITARAEAPTRMFESSSETWDLAAGLHKAFKELEHEISHAFRE